MAFNFNWSPLTADTDFYARARALLTTALNKSEKPPIIVDDILVNELNLGSVPPELEILEIGDLAEDRFRGIFKMCYSGDAFLTLKTRVQANPLNTYLCSKSSFTSPEPLAASSGLTIPLQITLSDIRLSAFIILVFSRQKGLTLVFRNDPLESLKVSSTFDSIPFVRDYLQKEIEKQLRNLMMDDLPAIIHKLSLRLWCPDHSPVDPGIEEQRLAKDDVAIDPLASPPQDAVDARGNVLDETEVSNLSLDTSGTEIHSLFSQKNLLRLAALNDSHRTLSLFTPSIRDAVFRAWASPFERGESVGTSTPITPSLIRSHTAVGSTSTTYTFSSRSSEDGAGSRPPISRTYSDATGLGLGAGRHTRSHGHRKRKTRVVNLRKNKTSEDNSSISGDSETSSQAALSEPFLLSPSEVSEEPEDTVLSPPHSPRARRREHHEQSPDPDITPRPPRSQSIHIIPPTPLSLSSSHHPRSAPIYNRQRRPTFEHSSFPSLTPEPTPSTLRSPHHLDRPLVTVPFAHRSPTMDSPASMLEQTWMSKLANEMARQKNGHVSSRHEYAFDAQDAVRAENPSEKATSKVADAYAEDGRAGAREDSPPPAYESALASGAGSEARA